jgi:UDP-GlcNAc:undecaprenyl-phosphate/decaprenyl-phosphate GlcNAc-1-phosphate transferase
VETIFKYIAPGSAALAVVILATPFLRKMAYRTGLVDRPDNRKVHQVPVPLIGGISILMATAIALSLSGVLLNDILENLTLLASALVILVTGVWDDRMNLKPVYRLLIQMACAYAVAAAGIRITSLYGIFGIEEIPVAAQYILTVLVISGVVNAFNLMDGIDGLLGSLVLITSLVLAVIAYYLGATVLAVFFAAIIGAVAGFLRYNFSGNNKVFMGDAGSLFLGFILIVAAIRLLNISQAAPVMVQKNILMLICGAFLVPVMDSLRVYYSRIKRGTSPFKADKTHLHHLLLAFGLSHARVTTLISIATIFLTLIVTGLLDFMPLTWALFTAIMLFSILPGLCNLVSLLQSGRISLRKIGRVKLA